MPSSKPEELAVGQRVKLISGNWKGRKGIITEIEDDFRFHVILERNARKGIESLNIITPKTHLEAIS